MAPFAVLVLLCYNIWMLLSRRGKRVDRTDAFREVHMGDGEKYKVRLRKAIATVLLYAPLVIGFV